MPTIDEQARHFIRSCRDLMVMALEVPEDESHSDPVWEDARFLALSFSRAGTSYWAVQQPFGTNVQVEIAKDRTYGEITLAGANGMNPKQAETVEVDLKRATAWCIKVNGVLSGYDDPQRVSHALRRLIQNMNIHEVRVWASE